MTTALLIIDVQREFFAATPAPHDADTVIARINALSARARDAGAPVVIIQHSDSWGPAVGSPGWQTDARLVTAPNDLRVRKATPDSFYETDLDTRLRQLGVQRVAVCGYASEFCIDSTCRRALELGYQVELVRDGHTTEDKPHLAAPLIIAHHNATLAGIDSFPGRIHLAAAAKLWTAH